VVYEAWCCGIEDLSNLCDVNANPARYVVHVPESSKLRKDVPVSHLRLALAKALKIQLTTTEQWRALTVLAGAEGSEFFRSGRVIRELDFGGDQLDEAIHQAVPVLLGYREVAQPDGVHVYLDKVAILEDHLHLSIWLAQHDPDMHRRLYLTESPDDLVVLSLDALLTVMDRTSANLARLQGIWDRAHPMLPTGPSGGSTNEYDDLSGFGELLSVTRRLARV
jgi:hypothetical protein